jgi:16S rRNA C1402 (ribose-2'-O) methylase RsmI
MTQIINKPTVLTARNLAKAFETVYTDFNIAEVTKSFWQLINKQKFEDLFNSDPSFKEMISNQEQLESFKNSLLKLKNFCSRSQKHQEIRLDIIENQQHKNWVRELS